MRAATAAAVFTPPCATFLVALRYFRRYTGGQRCRAKALPTSPEAGGKAARKCAGGDRNRGAGDGVIGRDGDEPGPAGAAPAGPNRSQKVQAGGSPAGQYRKPNCSPLTKRYRWSASSGIFWVIFCRARRRFEKTALRACSPGDWLM